MPSYKDNDEIKEKALSMFLEVDISKKDGHKYTINAIYEEINKIRERNGEKGRVKYETIERWLKGRNAYDKFDKVYFDIKEAIDKADKERAELQGLSAENLKKSFADGVQDIENMGYDIIRMQYQFKAGLLKLKTTGQKSLTIPITKMIDGKLEKNEIVLTIDDLENLAPSNRDFIQMQRLLSGRLIRIEENALRSLDNVGKEIAAFVDDMKLCYNGEAEPELRERTLKRLEGKKEK